MFGSRKPTQQPEHLTKIRLPKASTTPKMTDLQFLSAQASDNLGREVELTWQEPSSARTYLISVKTEKGAEPSWQLWEDDGTETKLVWKYQTIDFELINDVVCMLDQPSASAAPTAIGANQASAQPNPGWSGSAPLQQNQGWSGSAPAAAPSSPAPNQGWSGNSPAAAPSSPAPNQGWSGSTAAAALSSPAPNQGWSGSAPAAAPSSPAPNQGWSGSTAAAAPSPPAPNQGWSGSTAAAANPAPPNQAWSGSTAAAANPAPANQGWSGSTPAAANPPAQNQGWSGSNLQGPDTAQPQSHQGWSGGGAPLEPYMQNASAPGAGWKGVSQPKQSPDWSAPPAPSELLQPSPLQPSPLPPSPLQPAAPEFQNRSAAGFPKPHSASGDFATASSEFPAAQGHTFNSSSSGSSFDIFESAGHSDSGHDHPAQQRPRSMGFVPPFAPGAKDDAEQPFQSLVKPSNNLEGSLETTQASTLLQSISMSKLTGKLELRGEESVGDVYFADGVPIHASTPSSYGDGAIRELCTWEKGLYSFKPDFKTDMRSVDGRLDKIITDGLTMLDQKRHLKMAGLGYESYLMRKHKSLGESELRLMLTKGAPIDFAVQKRIYEYLSHKRTFTDLLRDHPMDSTQWTAILFNFLSCGLIDIKSPEAVKAGTLDFLGETQAHVQAFSHQFVRPETGIYTYAALMFFLEYEYYRFEAYNAPLALIVFELHKKREGLAPGTDLLTGPALNAAVQRVNLVKRPMDTLGHFETLDFALVLPHTSSSSAAWVATRMHESLTTTPLAQGLDRDNLSLGFGVASLPADGDTLKSLVIAAKNSKESAKTGAFPVVVSKPRKRSS